MRVAFLKTRRSLSVVVVAAAMALSACGSGNSGGNASTNSGGGGAASGGKATNVTVAVAGSFMGYATLYVADQAGYFKKHGLNVRMTLASGGPQVLSAVLSGSAQFSTTTLTEAANAKLQGQDVRIVTPQIKASQIECFVQPSLASSLPGLDAPYTQRVAALKGKTIGVTSVGGGVSIFLNYLLAQAHLKPTDVHQLAIGAQSSAWVAAMENKRLDAMCTGIPIGEEVVSRGFAKPYILPGRGDVPILKGLPETNLVASKSYIDKNPDVVKAFVAANYDAMKLIQDEPAKASAMIKKAAFSSLDPKVFNLAFKNFKQGFATTPVISDQALATATKFLAFAIPGPKKVTANEVYDGTAAEAVAGAGS